MARYILDTCTCIAMLKGNERVQAKIKAVGYSNCFVSEITIAELYFGAEKSGRQNHFRDVEDILKLFKVLPITSALLQYAKSRWSLERIGMKIDTMDLFIGSTALCNKMILVTGNTKHFERLEGLKLENWM